MLQNIKCQLDDPKVRYLFGILGEEYTEDIINTKLSQYRDETTHFIYGWLKNNEIIGICGFELCDDFIYLKDIVIDKNMRGCGIGSTIIAALQEEFNLPIKAETDDDAVEFYRKILFDISDAPPKHGVRRYALYRKLSDR